MAKKKRKATLLRQEKELTYNKYSPNRKARRAGIKPEEPPKEEVKTVSRAAVLSESVRRARKTAIRLKPPEMSYKEYAVYLKKRRQQLIHWQTKQTSIGGKEQ